MQTLRTNFDVLLGKYLQIIIILGALLLSLLVGLNDAFASSRPWLIPIGFIITLGVLLLWLRWNFAVFALMYLYVSLNLPLVLYQSVGIKGDQLSLIIIGACGALLIFQPESLQQLFRPTVSVVLYTLTIILYVAIGAFNVDVDELINPAKLLLLITLPIFLFGYVFGKNQTTINVILALTTVLTQISTLAIFAELLFPDLWYNFIGSANLSGASGLFLNRNAAALAIIPGVAAAFHFFYKSRVTFVRGMMLFCIGSGSLAIILSLSISGWLTLALTVFAFWLRSYLSAKKHSLTDSFSALIIIGALLLLFLGVAGFLPFENNLLSDVIARIDWSRRLTQPAGFLNDASVGIRSEVAVYYIEKFLENPFIGYGITRAQVGGNAFTFNLGPHNQFILLAVESGFVPVITYIGFFITLLVGLWRQRSQPHIWTLLVIFGGALFYQFFSHNMLDAARHYTMLLGLACGATSNQTEKQ